MVKRAAFSMLKDTDAKLTGVWAGFPALLGEDDLELKKLFVRRHCSAAGGNEAALVEKLAAEGLLTADAVRNWGQIPDVEELIAEARRKSPILWGEPVGLSPNDRQFRKAATFSAAEALASPALPIASGRLESGEVDTTAGESKGLLRRLKGSKKAPASQRDVVSMRKELERAERCDPSLKVVKFVSLIEFQALSPAHKGAAIHKLATGALNGQLEEVWLDNLGLDIAHAEAIAALLAAPKLKVLRLIGNKLNEAAVQRLARALRDHPGLRELALEDQNHVAMSTHAIEELLDAMETVPTLVHLRLGTVNDDAQRRRYLRLETTHVEGMRKLKGGGAPGVSPLKPSDPKAVRAKEV